MKTIIAQIIALLKVLSGMIDSTETNPVSVPSKTNPYTIVNHKLYRNNLPVRFEATTKMSGDIAPKFIIHHYTANNSLEGTVRVFKENAVSAHLILDRDGTVVQMVPFNKKAWHAGTSATTSKWGKKYSGLNSDSVGIEVINYGYLGNHVPKSQDTTDWTLLKHTNETQSRLWQPYTDVQIQEVTWISDALMKEYKIPAEHNKSHDEISPDRKVDTGPAYPLKEIKANLGDYL